MKNFKRAAKYGSVLSTYVLVQSAHAAADAAFTTAVTSITADIATYGGALVAIAAVGVAFAVGMKYVKKISRAA